MIVRSMSRKEASFRQLVNYVNREAADKDFAIHHNLLGRCADDIVDEFHQNAALLPKRKNANVMYHEIVSITRAKGLSERRQKEILNEIAQSYIERRAAHCLVYGVLHDDHSDHLHYHLVISANQMGMERRFYHSKKAFREIGKELEQRVLSHFPELEQKVSIDKVSDLKQSEAGRALKARTGQLPQKELVKRKLQVIFAKADHKQELFDAMDRAGLKFYVRGKSIGVIDVTNDRKHRLKKLALQSEFAVMSRRIEASEARLKAQNAPLPQVTAKADALRNDIKGKMTQTVAVPIATLDVKAQIKQVMPPETQVQSNRVKQVTPQASRQASKQAPVKRKEKRMSIDPWYALELAGGVVQAMTPNRHSDDTADQKVKDQTQSYPEQQSEVKQRQSDKDERLAVIEARMAEMEEIRRKQSLSRGTSKTLKR